MNKKKALGRGLASFLSEEVKDFNVEESKYGVEEVASSIKIVPIETLQPNPNQPRKYFNSDDLKRLSETIKEKGILQPLIVVKDDTANYSIVAGERRWRAAQLAQLHKIPIIVKELTEEEIIEIAIIENVQRSELNPLEEAQGYNNLAEDFNYSHEQIAKIVGKSRPYISNSIRLLSLPKEINDYIRNGDLTSGHARALLNCSEPISLSKLIVRKGLSVRQAELLARRQKYGLNDEKNTKLGIEKEKDLDTVELEKTLAAQLKLPIKISFDHRKKSGRVLISYRNLEELEKICDTLKLVK